MATRLQGLTQFTPAAMDISARSDHERLFSIIVLCLAMAGIGTTVPDCVEGVVLVCVVLGF